MNDNERPNRKNYENWDEFWRAYQIWCVKQIDKEADIDIINIKRANWLMLDGASIIITERKGWLYEPSIMWMTENNVWTVAPRKNKIFPRLGKILGLVTFTTVVYFGIKLFEILWGKL